MSRHELKSPRYWFERTGELLVAGVAAVLFMAVVQNMDDRERSEAAASEFFVVNSIYVPDHEVGSDPSILYDRQTLRDHRGFWVAEAQRQLVPGEAKFTNECSGSGVDNYTTDDALPDDGVSWGWFFGKPCVVPPGTYRIEMTKDIVATDYPVKSMRPVYSNTFRVYPRGELPRF